VVGILLTKSKEVSIKVDGKVLKGELGIGSR